MWRVILTAWSAVNSGLCAAALQDGPGCAEGHDAGDAENSGGSSLAAGKAWSLQPQRSSQSDAVAEKAEGAPWGAIRNFQGDQEGNASSQIPPDPVLVPALPQGGEQIGEHSEKTRG